MSRSPAQTLSSLFGGSWAATPLRNSSFCSTWRAHGPGASLFVKTLPANRGEALFAEADGLQALARTKTIKVPTFVGCWIDAKEDLAALALRWIDLQSRPKIGFGERLGCALGQLHLAAPAEGEGRFGWRRDNMLGATPQSNRWSSDQGLAGWVEFLRAERLLTMRDRLRVAGARAELIAAVDRVISLVPTCFEDGYVPRPSLVHGDLWSGNWGSLPNGEPIIFDPAVSISDPEAELAMMELFGSPPQGFWQGYSKVIPLHSGYARRRDLYQLYHILNHELLFGGYVAMAMATMDRLTRA